jgi:hypothetical protein
MCSRFGEVVLARSLNLLRVLTLLKVTVFEGEISFNYYPLLYRGIAEHVSTVHRGVVKGDRDEETVMREIELMRTHSRIGC